MPGQVYSVSSLGGNTSQPYLSQKIRTVAQPLFKLRQFIDAKEAIGMNKGDTFLFVTLDASGNGGRPPLVDTVIYGTVEN